MKPSKLSKSGRLIAACSVAVLAAAASPANAELFNFSSGGLSGTANITPGDGTVSVVLTNTTASITSIAQLLSDVSFSVSGGATIGSTQTAVPTGSLYTCANGTGCTAASGSANAWYYGMNGTVGSQGDLGGGDYILTALVGSSRSLILSTAGLGMNCNPKCPDGLSNTVNQPYLAPSGSFSLSIPGVTTDSDISHVVLSFGTAPETVIPIPAAVWLFGSGLVGLIGIARRRIASSSAPTPAFA